MLPPSLISASPTPEVRDRGSRSPFLLQVLQFQGHVGLALPRHPLARDVAHRLMEQKAHALGVSLQASRGPCRPPPPEPTVSTVHSVLVLLLQAVILESPVTTGPCPPCLSEAGLPVARRCLCCLLDRPWARAGRGAGL